MWQQKITWFQIHNQSTPSHYPLASWATIIIIHISQRSVLLALENSAGSDERWDLAVDLPICRAPQVSSFNAPFTHSSSQDNLSRSAQFNLHRNQLHPGPFCFSTIAASSVCAHSVFYRSGHRGWYIQRTQERRKTIKGSRTHNGGRGINWHCPLDGRRAASKIFMTANNNRRALGVNGLICAWQRNEKIKGIKLKIIKSDTRQKSIGRAADEWIFMRHTHLFT